MDVSKESKNHLLNEFDFIIRKIREEEDLKRKLYFFSGSYGALGRLMRHSLDPQLLLIHAVLNLCYGSLKGRLDSIVAGDTVVEMPQGFDEKLIEYLTELRNRIAENKDTYQTLGKFVQLAYQTTGAGYYTKNYLKALETKK